MFSIFKRIFSLFRRTEKHTREERKIPMILAQFVRGYPLKNDKWNALKHGGKNQTNT